jgi:hypothetical protein
MAQRGSSGIALTYGLGPTVCVNENTRAAPSAALCMLIGVTAPPCCLPSHWYGSSNRMVSQSRYITLAPRRTRRARVLRVADRQAGVYLCVLPVCQLLLFEAQGYRRPLCSSVSQPSAPPVLEAPQLFQRVKGGIRGPGAVPHAGGEGQACTRVPVGRIQQGCAGQGQGSKQIWSAGLNQAQLHPLAVPIMPHSQVLKFVAALFCEGQKEEVGIAAG